VIKTLIIGSIDVSGTAAAAGDVLPASAARARSLFRRYADQQLSSVSSGHVDNTSVEACAVACVGETQFQCRSFTFDNRHSSCLLYSVNVDDRDVRRLPATDTDLYDCEFTPWMMVVFGRGLIANLLALALATV